jgi:hypothetical protein
MMVTEAAVSVSLAPTALQLWVNHAVGFFGQSVDRRGGGRMASVSQHEITEAKVPRDVWRTSHLATLLLLPPVTWLALAAGDDFTLYQVQTQDLGILLTLPAILLIVLKWTPAWSLPRHMPGPPALLAAGCALVLLLGWGSYALMGDFPSPAMSTWSSST